MKTITIDIINEKAIKLLQDLENLKLIKLRTRQADVPADWQKKYKGAMTQQPLSEIDAQLNSLRQEWE